jgi:rhodanese-related sulfurtransferase
MVREVSPQEFVENRSAGGDAVLLDVREAWEVQASPAPDALHIPMGELPGRLRELDASRPVVVLCRSGVRSLQVAEFLQRRGFADVANLSGGILQWSRLDPSIVAY